MRCPSCSAQVPQGARFCSSCGHPLLAPTDERRVVTVVFGDLVGFTSLSETRDPESVKNLVDRCFARLAADITSYGGRVDKVVGDAVVALFGAPVAHEDDAERAVRAALAMQRTLEAETSEMGTPIHMRIGVNTGEVLVGALRAGGDYTAMGDVVNTASRLQTAALSGQVVVGPDTYANTKDVFRFEALGAVHARGRDALVEAWVAMEALVAPGSRPRRRRSPLVGREAELGLLCRSLTTAIAYRRPFLALIVGEAGMGKSRLAEEMATDARDDHGALVLEGRSVPYGEANVWWPLAEALRQSFAIDSDDSAKVARAKSMAAVADATGGGGAEDPEVIRTAEALIYLMGYEGRLSDVEQSRARDEGSRAMRAYLEGLARHRPVVLVLSDVQWADPLVLELVDGLVSRLHRLPVVVVLTARPELEDRWRPSPGRHNLVVLNLDPLDPAAAEELVTALLDGRASDEMRSLLVERSGGNPFFLEELAGLLAESGRIDTIPLGAVPVLPATLRGLVAARLDSLPTVQRTVLEDAAVLGRRGPVAALQALASIRGEEPSVGPALDALVDRDLLVVSDGRCGFGSDLVREVAYGTLTKAERARRHANLACWLEDLTAEKERTDEFLEELARHYAASAELTAEVGTVEGVPTDVVERAVLALQRAAERAEDRETHLVSERLYDQVLLLVGTLPSPARRHALIGRGRARTALRESVGAKEDLDAALSESAEAGDEVAYARALTVRGDHERNEGDIAASLRTFEEALGRWRRLGDRRGEAAALRRMGLTHLIAGELDEAEALLLDALAAFQELGTRKGVAWANQNLAWISFYRGEQDAAEARLNDAIALFADIGDWGGHAWALGLMGWVQYTQGHRDEAERLAVKIAEGARELGEQWPAGIMTVLLAAVRLWQGRAEDAVELAIEGRRIFAGIDDPWGECRALAPLSRALLVLGRYDEAKAAVEEVRELTPRLPGKAGEGEDMFAAVLSLGIAVHAGDQERAEAELSHLDLRGVTPDHMGEVEAVALYGLALAQVGRPEEGLAQLRRHVARRTDVGPRAAALAALAIVEAAADHPDDARRAADELVALHGGTYLDLVSALVGSACAAARQGEGEIALDAIDEAAKTLGPTDDRVTPAVVSLARSCVLEALGRPGADEAAHLAATTFAAVGLDGAGWRTALRAAAGLAP